MAVKTAKQPTTTETKASLPGTLGLITESWNVYKVHFRAYWPLFLVIGLNSGLSSFIHGLHQTGTALPSGLEMLFTVLLTAVAIYATTALILSLNKKAKTIQLIDSHVVEKAWIYFLVSICYGLVTVGGLLLLVVPGILWGTWYLFANYIVLTENLGIGDSFKKSKSYVRGYFWDVFRRQVFMGFLYVLMYLLIGTLIGSLLQRLGTVPPLVISIISSLLLIPFSGLFVALATIYDYQLYTHLKSLPRKTK